MCHCISPSSCVHLLLLCCRYIRTCCRATRCVKTVDWDSESSPRWPDCLRTIVSVCANFRGLFRRWEGVISPCRTEPPSSHLLLLESASCSASHCRRYGYFTGVSVKFLMASPYCGGLLRQNRRAFLPSSRVSVTGLESCQSPTVKGIFMVISDWASFVATLRR